MRKTKGYYTTDTSDIYIQFLPRFYGDGYIKAKLRLFWKKGTAKGNMIEQKNYKLIDKNIAHWKKYNPYGGDK